MKMLAGFDPGGAEGFGWALLERAPAPPFRIVATGIANHADAAFDDMFAASPAMEICAIGVDSPLYWTAQTRQVDTALQNELGNRGAAVPHGTVQSTNSLRGACLVQGILISRHVLASFPDCVVSECHPKVLIWQFGFADANRHHNQVLIDELPNFFLPHDQGLSEHERDAVLSGLSAWAALERPNGWANLKQLDAGAYSPLGPDIVYWMPEIPEDIA